MFSSKGDTMIRRTSFSDLNDNDTITTSFVIYTKMDGQLFTKSVIQVHEKTIENDPRRFPCADFQSIPQDTLEKYDLKFIGYPIYVRQPGMNVPENFSVTTDIISTEFKTIKNQFELVQKVKYELKLDNFTFHQDTVIQYYEDNEEVKAPYFTNLMYCKEIDRYFVQFLEFSNYYDQDTGKIMSRSSHKITVTL